MPNRSKKENEDLASLGPHTYAHAIRFLEEFPRLRITSGRRNAAENRAVGGARNSFHLRGRAIDVVGPLSDLRRAQRVVWHMRVGSRCTGPEEVLLEHVGKPNQHLHIAW